MDEIAEVLASGIFYTQEYIQLPALPGWTWYEAFKRYKDAGGKLPWPGLNSTTPRLEDYGTELTR